jgi:hypothetical protein
MACSFVELFELASTLLAAFLCGLDILFYLVFWQQSVFLAAQLSIDSALICESALSREI